MSSDLHFFSLNCELVDDRKACQIDSPYRDKCIKRALDEALPKVAVNDHLFYFSAEKIILIISNFVSERN